MVRTFGTNSVVIISRIVSGRIVKFYHNDRRRLISSLKIHIISFTYLVHCLLIIFYSKSRVEKRAN